MGRPHAALTPCKAQGEEIRLPRIESRRSLTRAERAQGSWKQSRAVSEGVPRALMGTEGRDAGNLAEGGVLYLPSRK